MHALPFKPVHVCCTGPEMRFPEYVLSCVNAAGPYLSRRVLSPLRTACVRSVVRDSAVIRPLMPASAPPPCWAPFLASSCDHAHTSQSTHEQVNLQKSLKRKQIVRGRSIPCQLFFLLDSTKSTRFQRSFRLVDMEKQSGRADEVPAPVSSGSCLRGRPTVAR